MTPPPDAEYCDYQTDPAEDHAHELIYSQDEDWKVYASSHGKTSAIIGVIQVTKYTGQLPQQILISIRNLAPGITASITFEKHEHCMVATFSY